MGKNGSKLPHLPEGDGRDKDENEVHSRGHPAVFNLTRSEFSHRLRQLSLENLIAASAADSDGNSEQAKRYRLAARMFSSWAEDLVVREAP